MHKLQQSIRIISDTNLTLLLLIRILTYILKFRHNDVQRVQRCLFFTCMASRVLHYPYCSVIHYFEELHIRILVYVIAAASELVVLSKHAQS